MAGGDRINLGQLLLGMTTRTRYVTRWSTFHILHKETVAEHSFFTAFYVMTIAMWLNSVKGMEINESLALKRALVHDIDEAYSGDFIRSFKYSVPGLKKMLDEASTTFCGQMCEEIAPGHVGAHLHLHWIQAKDDSVEGRIVAFADFLSVLSYAIMERRAGNRHIREENVNLRDYGKTFLSPQFEFLTPLPREAMDYLESEMLWHPGERV
jgi:5'-deoxynucleotidase YfbR-like HD superfamily hydrolase